MTHRSQIPSQGAQQVQLIHPHFRDGDTKAQSILGTCVRYSQEKMRLEFEHRSSGSGAPGTVSGMKEAVMNWLLVSASACSSWKASVGDEANISPEQGGN